MSKQSKVTPATTVETNEPGFLDLVKAAVKSESAKADLAAWLCAFCPAWPLLQLNTVTNKGKLVPAGIKKAASDLNTTQAKVKALITMQSDLRAAYIADYTERHPDAPKDAVSGAAYTFILSIKRHSPAFIAADTNRRGNGKAKVKAKPKAKPKGKAKAEPAGKAEPTHVLAGRSVKALHNYLRALAPAFGLLIDARGAAGLSTDKLLTLSKEYATLCEQVGKIK